MREEDDEAGVNELLRAYLTLSTEERTKMCQNARRAFLHHFEMNVVIGGINNALLEALVAIPSVSGAAAAIDPVRQATPAPPAWRIRLRRLSIV